MTKVFMATKFRPKIVNYELRDYGEDFAAAERLEETPEWGRCLVGHFLYGIQIECRFPLDSIRELTEEERTEVRKDRRMGISPEDFYKKGDFENVG